MKNNITPKYEYLNSNNNIDLNMEELFMLVKHGNLSWNLEVDVPKKKNPILVSVNINLADKKDFKHWCKYYTKQYNIK